MSGKVKQEDLAKALEGLQALAKGHSSRGTVTTEVESMADGSKGAGSGAGSTQVHHTASNSDRKTWAGSGWDGVSDNGPGADSVSENGTDYVAQAKVMKSIMAKLSKGQQLTADEVSILKGAMPFEKDDKDKKDVAKGAPPFPPKKGDKDEDEEEDKDFGKSLSDFASEDEDVSKGLEVSEFLASFVGVVQKSLQSMEERVVARLGGHIANESSQTGDFQKSLAEAVVNLGEAITAVAQRVEAVESAPARAPKSVAGVGYIEKGLSGNDEPLSKALVASALVSLAQENKVSPQDVIRFDTSGELSEANERLVRSALGR